MTHYRDSDYTAAREELIRRYANPMVQWSELQQTVNRLPAVCENFQDYLKLMLLSSSIAKKVDRFPKMAEYFNNMWFCNERNLPHIGEIKPIHC